MRLKNIAKVIGIVFLTILIVMQFFVIILGISWKHHLGKRPNDQPNTEWISEDGSIHISIDANKNGTGIMDVNGTQIDFILCSGPGTELSFYYPAESSEQMKLFELWVGNCWRADRITATVDETTYFEEGDKIRLYRMD